MNIFFGGKMVPKLESLKEIPSFYTAHKLIYIWEDLKFNSLFFDFDTSK
jgi:hypothetical protein